MSMICGIHRRTPGSFAGLDALLAALPAAEAAVGAAWTDGATGLGWRGDPNLRADQPERLPRVEPGPRLAVTASVRLDDRAGLCDALGVPRGQRADLADSALLLRAYERWGRECPNHLLGDYAFAVWDARRRILFLARDPVGTRPLFYSLTADRIVFASDVGAALAAPGVSDALDEAAVATLLGRPWQSLEDHTCVRAVRRLRPGHSLTVAGDSARFDRWWRPECAPATPAAGDDATADAFRELYVRAVEDRIRGVRRVGVHLSGGLDSSSVAALAARARRRAGHAPPPAFAWQPPPGSGRAGAGEATEHEPIEAMRRMYNLDVHYCPPTAADVMDYLRRDGTRYLNVHPNEEPVQRAAAEHRVGVLLSGWGGDEGASFNGRGYEAGLLRDGRVVTLLRFMRRRSRRPLTATLRRAALPLVWPAAERALRELRDGRWPWRRRTLMHAAFARRARPLPPPRLPRGGVRRFQLHLLQLGQLAERMDGWATSGARYGIEYAYPLLDRRLLEFALGLPPEYYRRGAVNRWLMRQALAPLLPVEVCRHVPKTDPVRYGAFQDALEETLPAARRILATRPAPPARGAYVDIPSLTANLDPERLHRKATPGEIINALRFLDF